MPNAAKNRKQGVHCYYLSEKRFKMSVSKVDFSAYNLSNEDVTDEEMRTLSRMFKEAFTKVGFVILENTGISQEEVEMVMNIGKKFFLQPDDLKKTYSRSTFTNHINHGWVSLECERLNPNRPGDLKEAFNITSLDPDMKWPSGSVAEFRELHTSFFLRCKELSLRVLRVMAFSLGLDPEEFLKPHSLVGAPGNGTTLRTLYYPPVNSQKAKEGQMRCGEHSDYGSITLLFQSSEGLQVRSRSGEFIPVPMIPGAILVNIADLMQRWTGDQFISMLHRVQLPPAGDSSTRQALAFFMQPDDDALITCCDGSDKYPPVTVDDYFTERFNRTYGQTDGTEPMSSMTDL